VPGFLYRRSTQSACARLLDLRFLWSAQWPVLAGRSGLCYSAMDLSFGVKDLSCNSDSSLAVVVIVGLILESLDRRLEFSYSSQDVRRGFSVMQTMCSVKCA
jgi:hypothetical protein